jgi:hypothetical protein
MSKLGHLDHIDAFEFAHYLCLLGCGTNPTLGWVNWFAPIEGMPNTYEFLQRPPTGTVLQVVMPFEITGAFASNGVKEIVVRRQANGKPIDTRIQVRPISQFEEDSLSVFMSSSTLSYLRNEGARRTLPSAGATVAVQLGAVDIPFACGTWNDLPRARRYHVNLNVDALLPSPADIENAVLDCFRHESVAATLATLLTPTGWPAGTSAFQAAVESGLQARLGDKLVNVRITAVSHCLDGERGAAAVTYLRPVAPIAVHARAYGTEQDAQGSLRTRDRP